LYTVSPDPFFGGLGAARKKLLNNLNIMGRTQNSYPKTDDDSFTFMFTLSSNGVLFLVV